MREVGFGRMARAGGGWRGQGEGGEGRGRVVRAGGGW